MKKMVLVIALAAIALSGSAFAQDPAYQDNIGVYTDMGATESCVTLPVGAATGYLVLSRLTQPFVYAWEVKLTPENLFITGMTLDPTGLDVAQRQYEHLVGYAAPLPVSGGMFVAATLNLLVANGNPGYILADEVYFSVQENGLPAYNDGNNVSHTLYPASGNVTDPVFSVNDPGCQPVATEDASFGSVKSLFR